MTTDTDRFSQRRSLLLSCLAAVTLLVYTSAAYADPAGPPAELPALGLRINDHGGGPPDDVDPPGLEIAANRFQFKGERGRRGVGRWHIEWDIVVNPDPFIDASLIVRNNLPIDQEFTFNIELPITPSLSGGTLIGGSFSGTLTEGGGNGATMRALDAQTPFYAALIDGNVVQTLFDNPDAITAQSFETVTFGPESFGNFPQPIPSLAGPDAANSTIGINLNFIVSANDSVTLTGTFVVEPVPEPSTVVLCISALIGLLAFGRRRRSR